MCTLLSYILRKLGYKPDPIKKQVNEETRLLNAYYSRNKKRQVAALYQPSNLCNFVHKLLGAISFLCIWMLLVGCLIYIFDK